MTHARPGHATANLDDVIVAAAVCPHPPLLVPEVARGAAAEVAELLDACDAAVEALLAADPTQVVVLAGGEPASWDAAAGGSLHGYGVDVHAGGRSDELPLGLTIGAWLLDRAGWDGARTYTTTDPDISGRTVVLVMADGSARRSVKAPGHLDPRAEAFDASIAAALASGDAAALAALDLDLADELLAAGARPLALLGRLASASMTKGTDLTARLRCDVAPFGVGYWVADWAFTA